MRLSYQTIAPELSVEAWLTYGWVEISVPADRNRGEANYSNGVSWPNPLVVFASLRFNTFETVESFNESRRRSLTDKVIPPVLYVHGFNHTFTDTAERLGQLVVDMGLPSRSVFFSWPSEGGRIFPDLQVSALQRGAYRSAQSVAVASSANLTEAIRAIDSSGIRYWLLAHSMGTEVFGQAGPELAAQRGGSSISGMQAIIVAAPDVDPDMFFDGYVGRIQGLVPSRKVLLYCAADRALIVSAAFNGTPVRLGYCDGNNRVRPYDGLHVTEITGNFSSTWKHDYYLTMPSILDHMQDHVLTPLASPPPTLNLR